MSQINKTNNSLFLQDTRKSRNWQFLIFVTIGIVVTFNLIFITYQDCSKMLGNRIYLICFSLSIIYGIAMWFNYFILVPRFLLKNKYLTYFLVLSIIVFLLPILIIAQEYWVRTYLGLPHRITSYTSPVILAHSLTSFAMNFICFFGGPVVILLRQWIVQKEEVSQMEYEHFKSEINKLKGQITPDFLSKTLLNAETFVKSNPEKTTDILMKLGQLLRYQLYDCNRDKVLLKSEINFLTNFLNLEQLNNSRFQYQIRTEGDLNNILVSPMLFISIVQDMIECSDFVDLFFKVEGEILNFRCQSNDNMELTDDNFYSVKRSLDLQYEDKYTFSQGKGMVELQLNISE